MDGQATKMSSAMEVGEPFRALVEQAGSGIVQCAPDGRILYANPRFCQFVGRQQTELGSLHLSDVLSIRESNSRALRPDGSFVPVHVVASPIQNATGETQSTCYVLLERTDQRQIEKFLFKALHDLRSPLGSASNLIQVLQLRFGKDIPKEAQWVADQIYTQIKRLIALLNATGQYVEAGTDQGATEIVALDEALQDALSNLGSRIEESGASVSRDSMPSVSGHRQQLVRVFENLIGNALSYRGTQEPRIAVTASRENGRCTICVRDNGSGFSPEYAEKVFVPFERLHGNSIPGSGLGLATARRIVEGHGGRIWAESQEGQGAAFFFTLPLR